MSPRCLVCGFSAWPGTKSLGVFTGEWLCIACLWWSRGILAGKPFRAVSDVEVWGHV